MWTAVTGSWKTESLRDDDQADEMEADKSANAFSYRGVSADVPAIATVQALVRFARMDGQIVMDSAVPLDGCSSRRTAAVSAARRCGRYGSPR